MVWPNDLHFWVKKSFSFITLTEKVTSEYITRAARDAVKNFPAKVEITKEQENRYAQ